MKKALLIVVTLLLLAAVPVTVFLVKQQQDIRSKAAPATALTLKPAVVTKNVGDTVTMDVIIDTGENLAYFAQLDIEYDPTVLDGESIVNGSIFPNVTTEGDPSQPGKMTITTGVATDAEPFNGAGIAATLKFKALAKTVEPTTIKFGAGTVVGGTDTGESKNLLVSSTPARVSIIDTSTPVPTETPPTDATGSADLTVTPSPTVTIMPDAAAGNDATNSADADMTAGDGGTGGALADTGDTVTPAPTDADSADSSPVRVLSPSQGSGEVSTTPLIQGTAPPNSTVTITIYSAPQTAVVTADASGNWSYTPTDPLEPGPHDIVVTAQAADGSTYNTTESFVVAGGTGGGTTQENGVPISGDSTPTLVLILAGILLLGTGLAAQQIIH